jgi:protein ImuB
MVAKQKNAVVIVAFDDAAARLGFEAGFPLANARAMCSDLYVIDEDKAADARALDAIADWCDRFTPLVARDAPDGLFLDITGCAHLFGGEAALMQVLCEALTSQGFTVNAAIAGTAICARAMTRVRRCAIVPEGKEAEAVGPLPMFALGADDITIRNLQRAGLKTIGDVALRVPYEITARFGDAFSRLLRQALGQLDVPISPRKPLPDYVVEKRLPEPVATDAVILGTLDKLAVMLFVAMERDGKGARKLEASFFRTDGVVFAIAVEAGRPVTRVRTIERLFREKLDALADPLDPGFGFDLIRLAATYVEIVSQEQRDLDAHRHDEDELAHLIDRISARIGPHRIVAYLPVDTHIPERAACAVPFQQLDSNQLSRPWPARHVSEPPLRPLRLFDPPEPIEVMAMFPDGPPAQFKWRRAPHRIVHVEGPERIAMEWWRMASEAMSRDNHYARDYFRVESKEGSRFWLYRRGIYSREVRAFEWFIQGIFA